MKDHLDMMPLYIKAAEELKLHRGGVMESIHVSFIFSDNEALAEYGAVGIAAMASAKNKNMSNTV